MRRPEVGQRLREIMVCSAHALEMSLMIARLEGNLRRVVSASRPAIEDLERLLGDIVQAQPAARLRLEDAAQQLATGRLTHARELLWLAEAVLERFRRQAALWRTLALDESAARRPVAVDAMVRELLELLEVEAAVGEVEIVFHEIEPVVVDADPKALARTLFGVLLGALSAARGGSLQIDLLREPPGGELRLTPAPGPGVTREAPAPVRLSIVSA